MKRPVNLQYISSFSIYTKLQSVLITIGNDSKFIGNEAEKLGFNKENIHHFSTKEDAINEMNNLLKEKDVILVKASRGMKLEKIVEYLNK